MNRKKILFIISNLETGGVSKSMTSLMNVIDRQRYDVALMITSPQGALMQLLPEDLRIITNPVWQALLCSRSGFTKLLRYGKPLLALGHLLRLALSCISKPLAARTIARLMPSIDEEFDTIVDFNGQHQLYYMVNKLKSRKKISFFHSDYKKWPFYYSADRKFYPLVDSIWTISETCADSLRELFPDQKGKIHVMENITSMNLIDRMADTPPDNGEMTDGAVKILTIGHVCDGKGSHWAIEAASILKHRSIDFHWYFLGANPDADFYNGLCRKFDVSDRITFLGIKVNPYSYLKRADIVCHPSRFEGKSIALDEAKLMCRPVVVTDFSTVCDQFENRVNASICQMNAQSIADTLEELITDHSLREKYIANLSASRKDNTDEIQKLYRIFDK